jgi:zinc and cadmium transporter
LLPHLWEATGNLAAVGGVIAAAVVASRLFDGACSCSRQMHESDSAQHAHTGRDAAVRSNGARVLLIGDFVHSLADGALIVAALAAGVVPGAVATMAIAMHEVPRRMAIVALQVHAGRSPLLALGLALCAGMGTVLGGALAWWSAKAIEQALPFALALSAAALLYIVLAQSAQAIHAWRARVFTLELGLPFLSGIFVVGVSHRMLEMLG